MLKIKNVNKFFQKKHVVNDVSFQVEQGEVAVLLGASGVGKSTLLRMVNNLDSHDSGTFELNGKPLAQELLQSDHRVGMVFQNFNLFPHLTVLENITLSLEKVLKKTHQEAVHSASNLLKEYDLYEKKDSYPKALSGGQKQRLALMRTLALNPQVICLDEPTSALDPVLTNYVATIIMKLAQKNYIVLVSTHDTMLLEKLDCTIYLMKEGKIVETAPSKLFFAHKNQYPLIEKFVSGA